MQKLALALTGAALAALIAGPAWATHTATHVPADKVAVAAIGVDFIRCTDVITVDGTIFCAAGDVVAAPNGSVRTIAFDVLGPIDYKKSSSGDLLFEVHAECALVTETSTTGNKKTTAKAKVTLFIELDDGILAPFVVGVAATEPVGPRSGTAAGEVVFCDRVQELETSNFDEADEADNIIRLLLKTRNANGFVWALRNDQFPAGFDNKFTITVKGLIIIDDKKDASSIAGAGLGKRTLVVEAVHLVRGNTF